MLQSKKISSNYKISDCLPKDCQYYLELKGTTFS